MNSTSTTAPPEKTGWRVTFGTWMFTVPFVMFFPMDKQVALGVEANVRWSMKQVPEHPDHRDAVKSGRVMVASAVYELATGRVRFLKNNP